MAAPCGLKIRGYPILLVLYDGIIRISPCRDFSKFWSSQQTLSGTWPNSLLYSIAKGPNLSK